ncbi:hypothetical protein PROFUN_07449 [Planoprotostelium fungivorum]|uniref:Uncharacterized protein n=1 Tax=Planoprotostelium fungivorum TaxID=1890364 RepID=A0A2P6NLE9_9EUKA|nr:hypothetical protein PROFUN_07449 [Planoprotostelium fungivorum]
MVRIKVLPVTLVLSRTTLMVVTKSSSKFVANTSTYLIWPLETHKRGILIGARRTTASWVKPQHQGVIPPYPYSHQQPHENPHVYTQQKYDTESLLNPAPTYGATFIVHQETFIQPTYRPVYVAPRPFFYIRTTNPRVGRALCIFLFFFIVVVIGLAVGLPLFFALHSSRPASSSSTSDSCWTYSTSTTCNAYNTPCMWCYSRDVCRSISSGC